MVIRLVWPACDSFEEAPEQDAFWVQCSRQEASHVRARYELDAIDPDEDEPPCPEHLKPPYCFLITKDLLRIRPMPGFFPYSGMWNGYGPFKALAEAVHIDSLAELAELSFDADELAWASPDPPA